MPTHHLTSLVDIDAGEHKHLKTALKEARRHTVGQIASGSMFLLPLRKMLHSALFVEKKIPPISSNPFTFNYNVIGEKKTLGRGIKSELPP